MDETVPHPSDVFVSVRWVGVRRTQSPCVLFNLHFYFFLERSKKHHFCVFFLRVEAHKPMCAACPPHRDYLQMILSLRRTMILEVFLPIIVPGWTHSSRKLPTEAESPHNSFSWKILQGTSLFSRFCSATMPASSRKQGICLQNRGGGTPMASLPPHQGHGAPRSRFWGLETTKSYGHCSCKSAIRREQGPSGP